MINLKARIYQLLTDTRSIKLFIKIYQLNRDDRLEKFYSFVFALLFGDGP